MATDQDESQTLPLDGTPLPFEGSRVKKGEPVVVWYSGIDLFRRFAGGKEEKKENREEVEMPFRAARRRDFNHQPAIHASFL
ncbi:MAG: hypothetical protein AAF514_20970 [Verrucomicrobiota bacterium]